MTFPPLKITRDILKKVETLSKIEEKISKQELEILTDFLNEKITKKQAIKLLKQNKKYHEFKKLNKQATTVFVELNNSFSNFFKGLNLKEIPKITLSKKPWYLIVFESLFSPSLTKEKTQKTQKKIKTKKKTKVKDLEIEKIEQDLEVIKPSFEPPKELLPENYKVLIPGYAYAFVKETEHERMYVVAEPELTKEEAKILENTKRSLINKISLTDLSDNVKMTNLVEKIFQKSKIVLTQEQKNKIVYYIVRQVNGLDKIEPLMHDPLIEDIECDGTGIPIFIVHRKYGHIVTNISLDSELELQQFIIKMAHLSKSYVSYASPLLDSILPDGSRVNATLTSNISTRGPTFTIRKFPQKPLTPIDLINFKTVTPEMLAYLWVLMEFKKNMTLIGPTAAGKTTLLNVISSFIPEAQRVISIEDTREISLLLTNWVPQITRSGFGPPDSQGKRYGEITMEDLLKESFRQRPDYLIIGEVRGEEIALMFQGMASGHCAISTVHAKSVEALVTRITTPPISLDPSLLTTLNAVVITGFSGIGRNIHREVKEIDEIKGYNSKEKKVEYNVVYRSIDKYQEKSETEKSDLFEKEKPLVYNSDILKDICKEYNLTHKKMTEIITNRTNFLKELTKNPPQNYMEFNKKLIAYKRKEEI